MQLTKSFRLLRFLNGRPGPVSARFIGAGGWLLALIFTRNRILARGIWRVLVHRRDLKTGMRQLAFYGRRSPLGINLLDDPVYDFATPLNAAERGEIDKVLSRRPRGGALTALDNLTLTAAGQQFPMEKAAWADLLDRFANHANSLLDVLETDNTLARVDRTSARKGDFSTDLAATVLRDFAQVCPSTTWPWYVVSGTFLGLIREGEFLAHDYDIDLGIHAEATDIAAIAALIGQSDQFILQDNVVQQTLFTATDGRMQARYLPVLLKIVHRSGLHIDLFVHYLSDGMRWHGSNVHRWENSEFDLASYQLAGTDVSGPADADCYLTENYGDWRVPVTDFNASTGTPNLRPVHNLSSLVLFFRRYIAAAATGEPRAKIIAGILADCGYLTFDEQSRPRFNPDRFSS